ncbi:MAG: hypothetical protein JRI34_05600 [Deltaproteobacteria bacterium]|nr:hypothetical protein [Deltaproteobacteria bacterium]
MAKDFEVYERAEELYIVDGLTLDQVAKAVGASPHTIEKWSAENGWKEARREYRQALGDIKRKTVLLRKKLVTQAMNSLDPQHVYAFARLEAVASQPQIRQASNMAGEMREIRTAQDAVDALQEALERKLNLMLAQPGEISLKAMKDMKGAMGLMDEIRSKYADKPETTKLKALDEEQAKFWREKVLGVN